MNRVWIVQQGEYSDRSIVGVFTDQETADEFAHACDGFWIDYPVNEPFERRAEGTHWHHVYMNRDGDTKEVRKSHYWENVDPTVMLVMHDDGFHLFGCFACDEEHAVKIANDRRRQMIAEGKL
jgi:hypothetical protein